MTDHDRLFKELITTFFAEFIELFLPAVAAYIERDSLVFLDKQIFTELGEGQRYETDIVVKVRFREQEANFLVHLENQAKAESNFGERVFNYFFFLSKKYKLPVYPIALFSYDIPLRQEPNFYRVEFPNKVVLDFKYDVIQLNRFDWRDFLNSPNPVASALMAKMKIAPQDRVKVKLECLRMLLGLKLNPARTQLISSFVDTYLRLNQSEKQEFQAELEKIVPIEKEKIMQLTTSWKEEGIVEGIVQGKADLVGRLLNHRFGQIEPNLETPIQELDENQLDELTIALLSFSGKDELISWLESHSKMS